MPHRADISTKDIIRLYVKDGLGAPAVAARLGVNPSLVVGRLRRAGVKQRRVGVTQARDFEKRARAELQTVIGKVFGRWTVIGPLKFKETKKGRRVFWNCRCACGVEKFINKQRIESADALKCRRCAYNNLRALPNTAKHFSNGTTVIFLQHKRKILRCVIDTSDYPLVQAYRWHAVWSSGSHTYYVLAEIQNRRDVQGIHRLILPGYQIVDHRDHNGLHNRRKNLRPANPRQSARYTRKKRHCGGVPTTSRYKGVHVNRGRYRATIRVHGKLIHLGRFDNEKTAAHAYDVAARKFFGRFRMVNFPNKSEASALR